MAIADKVDTGPYEIRWGPILSGAFVSLGIWMFLYALGAAIGGAGNNRGPTSWTAVYVLIAPIIALFFGGVIVARGQASSVSRGSSMLHAAVVWGFSMVMGAFLLGTLGTLGAATLFRGGAAGQNVSIPSGYSWAVAGSILFSLFAALLGSSTVTHEATRRTPLPIRRDVEA